MRVPDYAFPAESGPHRPRRPRRDDPRHGDGRRVLVLLEPDETFLTADLHTEFHRATRPGTLRADGRVVHRTRRVMFCAAELYDAEGTHLASARCTQVLRNRSVGRSGLVTRCYELSTLEARRWFGGFVTPCHVLTNGTELAHGSAVARDHGVCRRLRSLRGSHPKLLECDRAASTTDGWRSPR